ncbi:MAG: hypothetical protein ABIP48_11810 [Planctomycetota bacterium]
MNRPRLWLTLLLLSGASATPAADVPGPWVEIPADFGWDADNNAATAGTIIGVIRGHAWMRAQGWQIADRYRNTTRPRMPEDETITRFAGRLIAVADRVILERGGQKTSVDGQTVYRIRREAPANVEPLADAAEQWARAVAALNEFPDLLRLLAESPTPAAALRKQAAAVGVETPGDEGARDDGGGERGEGREVRGRGEGINGRVVPDRSYLARAWAFGGAIVGLIQLLPLKLLGQSRRPKQ